MKERRDFRKELREGLKIAAVADNTDAQCAPLHYWICVSHKHIVGQYNAATSFLRLLGCPHFAGLRIFIKTPIIVNNNKPFVRRHGRLYITLNLLKKR